MRLLDLGCGSGAAAEYFGRRRSVDITCVTNSSIQGESVAANSRNSAAGSASSLQISTISAYPMRALMRSTHSDRSAIPRTWTPGSRLLRMLRPGGRLLIRSPGSLDFCRREKDFWSVTAFFENWRYNFLGANVLVFCRAGPDSTPSVIATCVWAWGLTWNFFQHLYLWKFKLRMRTMVDLEKIIWRTSKRFVFGNGYNIVLAIRPADMGVR